MNLKRYFVTAVTYKYNTRIIFSIYMNSRLSLDNSIVFGLADYIFAIFCCINEAIHHKDITLIR
jgi:hypothetical protein